MVINITLEELLKDLADRSHSDEMQQFAEVFGADRQVSVCREISKLHEESVRGSLAEVVEHFTQTEPRGEIVIVLAGVDNGEKPVKEKNVSKNKYKDKN
jgi:16S rRNA (cytidine1402-2'-O)-methyltransferase